MDAVSPSRIRQRYICGDHFDKKMYMNPNAKVLKLIPNAIPKKYINLPESLIESKYKENYVI